MPDWDAGTFLHVGCGHKRKDRTVKAFAAECWREVTLDIDPTTKPDLVDSLPNLAAVESGTFDAVYSAHNIEHLYLHEVPQALAAFRRVLKDDGFLVITCPDLQAIGERLASGDVETPLYSSRAGPVTPLDVLYGFGPSVARGNQYMAHHAGFTLASLAKSCREAGFSGTAGMRRPHKYDLWLVATKAPTNPTELRRRAATFLVPV